MSDERHDKMAYSYFREAPISAELLVTAFDSVWLFHTTATYENFLSA